MGKKQEILQEKYENMYTTLSSTCVNLQRQIDTLYKYLKTGEQRGRNTLCVNDLTGWVKCSVVGHNMQLKEVYAGDSSDSGDRCVAGLFKCSKCGIKIERKLTEEELKKVKQLGMI